MPCGMNRIAAISTAPISGLAGHRAVAAGEGVEQRGDPVAPTAGPAQCRVPPSTLIRTTVSGTVIENISPTVT